MTKLIKTVSEARAFRDRAIKAYAGVTEIRELELLRTLSDDPDTKKAVELVLMLRKRGVKRRFEAYERWADAFDKAALPVGAAMPGLVTVLSSEHTLVGEWRHWAVLGSCVAGALLWGLCRLASLMYGLKAKVGAVDLGKVD